MVDQDPREDFSRWTPDRIVLINNEQVETPQGLVPVYHQTHEHLLESIFREGLKPNNNNNDDPVFTLVDSFSPTSLRRRNSVFANPLLYPPCGVSGHGGYILTTFIDPNKFDVYDSAFITEARIKYNSGDLARAEDFAKVYWESRVPMTTFLALPEERRWGITFPEVLLAGVAPESLRLTHTRTDIS